MALPVNCSSNACVHGAISHASRCPPDVILRRSFTSPSTALAVIEGLGTRLKTSGHTIHIRVPGEPGNEAMSLPTL